MGEGTVILYDDLRFGVAIKELCSRFKISCPSRDWWVRVRKVTIPFSQHTFVARYIETDVPESCNPDMRDWLYCALFALRLKYGEFCRRAEKTLQKAEVARVEVWT